MAADGYTDSTILVPRLMINIIQLSESVFGYCIDTTVIEHFCWGSLPAHPHTHLPRHTHTRILPENMLVSLPRLTGIDRGQDRNRADRFTHTQQFQ